MAKRIKRYTAIVGVFVIWSPLIVPMWTVETCEMWRDSKTAQRLYTAGEKFLDWYGVVL